MAAVSFKKVFLSRFAWLCAKPGHARAATDVDVFETFASVYNHTTIILIILKVK